MARFNITEDHLAEPGERTRVNYGMHGRIPEKPYTYRFRTFDDDGELYYCGECDERGIEAALDFAQADAGATRIDVQPVSGGAWETVIG